MNIKWHNGNWKDTKCNCQFVNSRYPFWSKTLYDKIDQKVAQQVMGVVPLARKVTAEQT